MYMDMWNALYTFVMNQLFRLPFDTHNKVYVYTYYNFFENRWAEWGQLLRHPSHCINNFYVCTNSCILTSIIWKRYIHYIQ